MSSGKAKKEGTVADWIRDCATPKEKHDLCFFQWMRDKFLVGKAIKDDCEMEWKEYQSCVSIKLDKFNMSSLLRASPQLPPNISNVVLSSAPEDAHANDFIFPEAIFKAPPPEDS
jgi:hypothetical protein